LFFVYTDKNTDHVRMFIQVQDGLIDLQYKSKPKRENNTK